MAEHLSMEISNALALAMIGNGVNLGSTSTI